MRKLFLFLLSFLFLVTACGSKTDSGALTPEQLAQLQQQQLQQQQQQYYQPGYQDPYQQQYTEQQYYQQTTTAPAQCTGYLTVYGDDGVNLGDLTPANYQGSLCGAYNTVRNPYSGYGSANGPYSAYNPAAQYPPIVYCWDGAALQLSGYLTFNTQFSAYGQVYYPTDVFRLLGCP